jgi:prophage regulatory protein
MEFEKPDRILRLKSVIERTGLSRSTVYRKIDDGSFPRQIKIAERCVGWRESHIDKWLSHPPVPKSGM